MLPPTPDQPSPVLSLERCDPDGLIRQAIASEAGPSSRDVFLVWLLRLPHEVDAAQAAGLLLVAYDGLFAGRDRGLALQALLEETTSYPRERLDTSRSRQTVLH